MEQDFLPDNKSYSKEMLPVLTKPLIQYGVEEALGSWYGYNGSCNR